ALGAMFGNTSIDGVRIPTPNPDYNRFFVGDIAEVIYFNEPNLTNNSRLHKARNTIIHNYLSAKFNIPLTEGQVADLDFADASTAEPLFNKELAGVGRTLDGSTEVVHGLAQGPAPLRVRSPIFNAPEAYLTWAHNGESLTDTWPYSFWNADLPENILERSGRVWKFYQSAPDAVSSVDIEINFGSSASAADFANDRGLLRLLTHTNEDPNDFSGAQVYNIGATQPPTGTFVNFSAVPVTDGMYVALANTSNIVPLPIELIDFNARLNGEDVDLTWSTASETNNDFFTIQRADESLVWDDLFTVPGAGNSNTRLNYRDIDRNPLIGTSYYRLKQTDFDGSFSYSEIKAVRNIVANDEDNAFVFPNPSYAGRIFVKIPHAYSVYRTEVRLFNLSGQLVWQGYLNVGTDVTEINYGSQPAGIYLIELRSELFTESKKLVIE
ncbi:MAG: T9SS type A sorting domain-containing protein, partial [Cryomorphaceae bacterium]